MPIESVLHSSRSLFYLFTFIFVCLFMLYELICEYENKIIEHYRKAYYKKVMQSCKAPNKILLKHIFGRGC